MTSRLGAGKTANLFYSAACAMLYCNVLGCIVLSWTALCCPVLPVLRSQLVQCCTVLSWTALCCPVLPVLRSQPVQCCTVHCPGLQCTVLCSPLLPCWPLQPCAAQSPCGVMKTIIKIIIIIIIIINVKEKLITF